MNILRGPPKLNQSLLRLMKYTTDRPTDRTDVDHGQSIPVQVYYVRLPLRQIRFGNQCKRIDWIGA